MTDQVENNGAINKREELQDATQPVEKIQENEQLAMLDTASTAESVEKNMLDVVVDEDVHEESDAPDEQDIQATEADSQASTADNQTIVEAAPSAETAQVTGVSAEESDAMSEDGFAGISTSTWLWGLGGVGAAALALGGSDPAPAAPSVSLSTDTGVAGDGITSEAVFTVSGLEDGATWEYSTDGGSLWTTGSGTSFTVSGDGNYSVVVRQETSKQSENSAAISVTIDTASPIVQSLSADSSTNTLTLTFSENLNANQVPEASEMTIEQNGQALMIESVAIDGNTVVVTVSALDASAVQVTYSGSTLQDAAGNTVDAFLQAVVSDGYISGGKVYLDANNDGIATADELLEGVTTDEFGQVLLTGDAATGNIIVTGGVNTDTGTVNTLVLKAPAGFSVVNPLSTLVAAVIENATETVTLAEAEAVVVAATGLVLPEGETLSSYDPLADTSAGALEARKVVAQIATVLAIASTAASDTVTSEEAVTKATNNLAKVIADAAANQTQIVVDAATLATVYDDGTGSSSVAAEAITAVVQAASVIETATDLETVITEQAKATDTVAPDVPDSIALSTSSDSGASSADGITNMASAHFDVELSKGSLDGTDVVAGDIVLLYNGGTVIGSQVVTKAELAAGIATVTVDSALADGDYSLKASVIDRADNESALSGAVSISIDTTAAVITSTVPTDVNENTAIGTVVYTATATDANDVTFSLKEGSDAALTIDATSGEVSLVASPDFETATSHAFTVVANDLAGNTSEKALTLNITNVDDTAPEITSAAAASAIDENSGADQVVYTATATDDTDVSEGFTFSLKAGASSDLSIDADSGAVTLAVNPDHETVASYDFTVVASDVAGNASEKAVSLVINDLDDTAPIITSDTTVALDENTTAGTVLYTATADDSADVSDGVVFSLKAGSDSALSIDSATGAVTASKALDHETQDSYSFTVVATDTAGNASEKAVTMSVNDLNEAPTATAIADQLVVTDLEFTADLGLAFSDEDAGDSLTFALTSGELPTGLSLSDAGVLSGTVTSEYASSSFTITATDSKGLTEEQTFDLKVVAAPVVDSISVSDNTAPTGAAIAGETITVTLNMSEAFTLNTTSGSPSLGLLFGESSSEVTATFVSTEGTTLTFTATTPEGDGDKVSLGSISLNGASLVGELSGQPWEISSVGQSAGYILDNTAPVFNSAETASVDENTAIGSTVYSTSVTDGVGGVTFALKSGSDEGLEINAETGVVTLLAVPNYEAASTHVFTVVATDSFGHVSEQEVILSVNDLNEAPTKVGDLSDGVFVLDVAIEIDVTSGFADQDGGDNLVYSVVSGDLPADVSLSAAGILSGTISAEFSQTAVTIRATDSGGLYVDQAINLKGVSAPVVDSIFVTDSTSPSLAGVAGESLTVVLTMSESFELSTAAGNPSIGLTFGSSTSEVVGTYVSSDATAKTLTFSATTPAGDASEVSLTSITLNGATLVGSSSAQSWQIDATGQKTAYSLDNSGPLISSSASSEINEAWPVGKAIYTAEATDANDITYSLAAGAPETVSIDAESGEVVLSEMPGTTTNYVFTVVATDALGNESTKAVDVTVNAATDVTGPGEVESGALSITKVDNGDGSYTLQFFVADSVKANYPDGLPNIDLVINYDADAVEAVTLDSVDTPLTFASSNVGTPGQIIFGGGNIDFSNYDVNSDTPIYSVTLTPVGTGNVAVTVTDVLFDSVSVASTSVVYGDPVSVTGDAGSDAYLLVRGEGSIATGDGEDRVVLTETTGDHFSITDFVSGTDSIEFGVVLEAAGYTSVGSGVTAADNVATELLQNPSDILALIEANDASLDNVFGGSPDTSTEVVTLFYDANPAVGSVDIQTFDLNIGSAIADFDSDDITGFIA